MTHGEIKRIAESVSPMRYSWAEYSQQKPLGDLCFALAAYGLTYLAKAVLDGESWVRNIKSSDLLTIQWLEDDAARPGWTWNKIA